MIFERDGYSIMTSRERGAIIDIQSLTDQQLADLREQIDSEADKRLKSQLTAILDDKKFWYDMYDEYIGHPLFYHYTSHHVLDEMGNQPEPDSESYQAIIDRVAQFNDEQLSVMLHDIAIEEIRYLRHYVIEGTPPKVKDRAGTILLLLVIDELYRRGDDEETYQLLDDDSDLVTDCEHYIKHHLDYWERRFKSEDT